MIWFSLLALWLLAAGLAGHLLLAEDRIRWLASQRGYPERGLMLVAMSGGAGGMLPVLLDQGFAQARRPLQRWVWIMVVLEVVLFALVGWLAATDA